MEMDSRVDCGPIETWKSTGKNLREKHLRSAIDNYDGWVDVVIRQGGPEEDSAPSNPWDVRSRKHKFRVQEFDERTGHFSIKLLPFEED